MTTTIPLRKSTLTLSALLLCLCLCVTWCGSGCKTKEQAAYVGVQSVVTSVDIARGVANDMHRAGKMTDAQFEQARAAYIKYQAAVRVLRDVVIAAKENPDAPGIDIASKAVSASAADVVALVEQFTKGSK